MFRVQPLFIYIYQQICYFVLVLSLPFDFSQELAQKGDAEWGLHWSTFLNKVSGIADAPQLLRSMCGVIERAGAVAGAGMSAGLSLGKDGPTIKEVTRALKTAPADSKTQNEEDWGGAQKTNNYLLPPRPTTNSLFILLRVFC